MQGPQIACREAPDGARAASYHGDDAVACAYLLGANCESGRAVNGHHSYFFETILQTPDAD